MFLYQKINNISISPNLYEYGPYWILLLLVLYPKY